MAEIVAKETGKGAELAASASSADTKKIAASDVATFDYCQKRFAEGQVAAQTDISQLSIGSPQAIKARTERLVCDGKLNPDDYKHPKQLKATARYLESEFTAAGARVIRQTLVREGKRYLNVVAEFGSTSPEAPLRVIGFHYDKHGELPGAKDNDVSVATGLELARHLKNNPPQNIRVQLVAYTLEECSFPLGAKGEDPRHPESVNHITEDRCYANHESMLGSKVHATSIANVADAKIIVLDSIGSYSNKESSQTYVGWESAINARRFGTRGNYISLLGDWRSRHFAEEVAKTINTTSGLPANSAGVPRIRLFEDYFRSDHASYPAEPPNNPTRAPRQTVPTRSSEQILATDTANFRFEGHGRDDYHTSRDTPDAIKYSKVSKAFKGFVAWIASEDARHTPE